METRCPECDKRLRLPDTYTDQRIRCRNCGTIFRPTGLAQDMQVEAPTRGPAGEVAAPRPVEPTAPRPTYSAPRPATRPRGGGGGIGIAIVIALMLLSKVPRLIQNFGDRNRNKPVPAELRQENLRALQEALKEIEERPAPVADEFGEPDAGKAPPDPRQDKDSLRQDRNEATEVRS